MENEVEREVVGIVGAGWLGLPLAETLAKAGYPVRASTTSPEKLAAIRATGAEAWRMALPDVADPALFAGLNHLVITLPPGGRRLSAEATARYLTALGGLPGMVAPDTHILYCSSTGVYGKARGIVNEERPLNPVTHSGRAVAAAERYLKGVFDRVTILRLAGLVGPGRHPGRFYGGRAVDIRDADAPINLVHQHDVIEAIRLLLGNVRAQGKTYNVVASCHPPKGSFYRAAAGAIGLETGASIPGGAEGKIVASDRLARIGWKPRFDEAEQLFLGLV